MIQIANAPCSWGALEFDLEREAPNHQKVLTEIKETGYSGTELGDWGFMPTDPTQLRDSLDTYGLELVGAFVPVALSDPANHRAGIDKALKVADLIVSAGYQKAFIVLADDNGKVKSRTKNAGRISGNMGLAEEEWDYFADGSNRIASALSESFKLKTVFHHHCGGYVETPFEVEMLMTLTDPDLIGLCLDTGHYRFGGGDPLDALQTYRERIWHVHFKDYDPEIGEQSRTNRWDYIRSVEKGVFCELGKGEVDFNGIVNELKSRNYDGWIVVEQDILPGMGNPKFYANSNRNYIKSLGL